MDNQDRELMKQATQTISELNTLTDAQAQELQGAREEIERLTFDSAESMRQYNAQQKRACETEAENGRLLAALEAVEWVPDENAPWRRYCHWCSQYEEHAPDCQRQAALEATE